MINSHFIIDSLILDSHKKYWHVFEDRNVTSLISFEDLSAFSVRYSLTAEVEWK